MTALEPYYFEPNMLHTALHTPRQNDHGSEDSEVDNRLERNTFC